MGYYDDYYYERDRMAEERRNNQAADREARRLTARVIAVALEFSETPNAVQSLFDAKGNDEEAVKRSLRARKAAKKRAEDKARKNIVRRS